MVFGGTAVERGFRLGRYRLPCGRGMTSDAQCRPYLLAADGTPANLHRS